MTKGIGVAIIDDDEAVRDSSRVLLEAFGFTTKSFESAEEFLESDAAYDCLIVDHNMPGMNGLELIALQQRRGSTAAMLLVTGRGGPEIEASARLLGVRYLAKPVVEEVLVREIEAALSRAAANANAAPRRPDEI